MDNISVIIRNKNEERYIGYSIQSVLDTFDKPEIIVVNNNSIDESMSIVKSFNFSNIKTYNIDGYSPGKSLNYGVTKCSNDYVLVLSAHSQIMNCEFGKIKDLLDEYCVVGGKQIPIYRGKKIKKLTVNTCSLDHKSAIYLYQKYGFTPVKYKDLEKTV